MAPTRLLAAALAGALLLSGCAGGPSASAAPTAPTATVQPGAGARVSPDLLAGRPGVRPARACSLRTTEYETPPPGAVVVRPGTRLDQKVAASPAGTTYWLAPGRHTLGAGRYDQVQPHDGDTFIGAPRAVLDGQRKNRYAFTGHAADVTILGLTVRRFGARGGNHNEGVVNHDSGAGWRVAASTIEDNAGAGLMLGDRNVLVDNCLRDNGQYAFNAYQAGDGITGLKIIGNEIVGNNTDNWEKRVSGCGCTGGGKFWAVHGADVIGNYVHDNHGAGLWADTDDTDFLFRGNYIADNDAEGIFYEISYNARITGNVFVRNGLVKGPTNPGFPTGAIYLSESGSDPRAPGRYGASFEIDHNLFRDNWSGVVGWENADRFAGSPANTSSGYTTLVDPAATLAACGNHDRGASQPLYDDCRWRTQNLDVHDNVFRLDAGHLRGCTASTGCGLNALIAGWGTYPSWSPYQGDVVQQAIVNDQHNVWRHNTYVGPWRFAVGDPSRKVDFATWQFSYGQDIGSTRG